MSGIDFHLYRPATRILDFFESGRFAVQMIEGVCSVRRLHPSRRDHVASPRPGTSAHLSGMDFHLYRPAARILESGRFAVHMSEERVL